MIKVIVSDLGNVLIPFDYGIAIQRFNAISPGLGEQFYTFAQSNYDLHRKFERGDIPQEEFISIMLNAVDNKVDRETFCRYYSEIFTENIEVTGLLPILKNNFRLVLLSNTNEIHYQYGWKNYEFLEHFEALVLSHKVGFVKPEMGIYKAVEIITQEPPEAHIFIDDIEAYATGAKECGWDAIHYTDPASLKRELSKRNLLGF